MQKRKVIIIGSGVAGLATAIRMAVMGYPVNVYEKNPYPGGKLSAFEKKGYHFDEGPSLFTQPKHIEELFLLANEPIEKYFTYEPVEIACKYFYENGKVINAWTNSSKFALELKEMVNEDPAAVINYLKRSEDLYENIGTLFLNHTLHKKGTWLNKRIIKALGSVGFSHLFSSLHQFNSKQFSSPETIQLFDRFATYNGSSPYKSPAMMSMIPHLELNDGVFYPKGGMIAITNALVNLAMVLGVQFNFNSPVQRIIQLQGMVKGVVVNGQNIAADIVVSNSDVYFTYKDLLRDTAKVKKLLKQERSSSAVIFYWGMNRQFARLQLHNIFFSKDYKKEFAQIFKSKQLHNDPTVYINITVKMETTQAPPGKENWFVMVNVPANSGQDWNGLKQDLRTNIIRKLNRILGEDIEQYIETEEVADPVIIENKTASYMGALYGSSSNSKLAAFFRKPNFSQLIKGLYFCGGSVHPGGGIPLCLKSAKIVTELIQNQDKKIS